MRKSAAVQLLLGFCLFFLLFPASSALAQQPAPSSAVWASYYLHADFSSRDIRVTWTPYIGQQATSNSAEHLVLHHGRPQELLCQTRGNLFFKGDATVFDGKSYVECEMPSLQSYVAQHAPKLAIESYCECQLGNSPFWTAAELRLDGPLKQHPIFAKEDLGLSIDTTDGQAFTKLHFAGHLIESTNFWTPSPNGNRLWIGNGGGYFHKISAQMGWSDFIKDFRNHPQARPFLEQLHSQFSLWEWVEDSYGTPQLGPAFFYRDNYVLKTDEDTIYFGYEPSTSEYFTGGMRFVEVDPGCRGGYRP